MRLTIGSTLFALAALSSLAEARAQQPPRLSTGIQFGWLEDGARQPMWLEAGPDQANQPYIVLGSLSGTYPGVSVGGVHLPLNVDSYTTLTLTQPNTFLAGSFGLLDGNGRATAELVVPPGLEAWVDSLIVNHAYVILDGNSLMPRMASEPVVLRLAGEPVACWAAAGPRPGPP